MGEEILIGRIAVQRGFLTPADLDRAVEIQAKTDPRRPLGEILVEHGMLTRGQVASLLTHQGVTLDRPDTILPRKKGESLFGRLALKAGFCSESQLNDALRLQAQDEESGNFRQLGDILVEQGWMSPADVRQVLEQQQRSLLWCQKCGAVFNVAHVVKRTARCPTCGIVLSEARSDQVSAEAQIAFTPEGMRVASLLPEASHEAPASRPVGTIVARRFKCASCGNDCVVLLRRGASKGKCPTCRVETDLSPAGGGTPPPAPPVLPR